MPLVIKQYWTVLIIRISISMRDPNVNQIPREKGGRKNNKERFELIVEEELRKSVTRKNKLDPVNKGRSKAQGAAGRLA